MKRFLFLLSLCFIFIACETEMSNTKVLRIHNTTDEIVYMETVTIDGEFLSQAILPDSTGYAMRHLLFPYKNSKTEITKLIPINILYDNQWFFVDGTDSLSWMYKDNFVSQTSSINISAVSIPSPVVAYFFKIICIPNTFV